MMKHKVLGSLLCLMMGCSAMPVAFAGGGFSKERIGPHKCYSSCDASCGSKGRGHGQLLMNAKTKRMDYVCGCIVMRGDVKTIQGHRPYDPERCIERVELD